MRRRRLLILAASLALLTGTIPFLSSTSAAGPYAYRFVDTTHGSDTNPGTSQLAPWRTLARASAATLAPRTKLLLRRGQTFAGDLTISESGNAGDRIIVSTYGPEHEPLPVVTGACITLAGDYLTVRKVQVDHCTWAGIEVTGDRAEIDHAWISNNVTGVFLRPSSDLPLVHENALIDNNRMSVNTPGGDDDSGAFGVLSQGTNARVAANIISGSDAASFDYGRDGAAIEVYGGRDGLFVRNSGVDNETFAELGGATPTGNAFHFNLTDSNVGQGKGFVVPGSATGTTWHHNTVVLTGATSQGIVCFSSCTTSTLNARDNITVAVAKAVYGSPGFSSDYNLYRGPVQQPLGGHDSTADPLLTADLHLSAGSPARDSGVSTGLTPDLDGTSVPQGPAEDRGAFEYRGGDTTTTTPPPSTTQPSTTSTPPTTTPSGGLRVAAVGDIQPEGSSSNSNATAARANAADLILGLGDYQYDSGSMSLYNRYFDLSWGPLVHKMYPVLAPNHDQYWTAGETMDYWNGGGAHGYRAPVTLRPLTPYSFDRNGWHFIALPDACGRVSGCSIPAITSWLQADLAAHPVACTVAYWHQAYFTSSTSGHGQESSVRPWVDALYAAHADIILQGHNHDYERFNKQSPSRAADPNGLQAFVVGTGGIGFYSFTDTAPNSAARVSGAYGVLELGLGNGTYTWNFARTGGSAFSDSGSMACR